MIECLNANINQSFGYNLLELNSLMDSIKNLSFEGGLYAAHCIKMGDFDEWKLLSDWVNDSSEYNYDRREPLGMKGSLEEHLNAYTYYRTDKENQKIIQLDLLIPIKLI